METPNQWIIIKIKGDDPHYRVFASWSGGYLDGDHWKLNSGIVDVEEDGDFYLFKGFSGSVYRCYKESYGISSVYNMSVIKKYQESSNGIIEIMNEMPDIMNMDWIIK